ncbi:zinc finger protein 585B-like [Culicoides brevitarsis]|uniref:zinc finger protein 585B-like n=1 Tax=Culicoides brevitarsis TaxID=469753 RepID=UPI00307C7B64
MNFEMLQSFGESHFLPVLQEDVVTAENEIFSRSELTPLQSLPSVDTINSSLVTPFTIAVINPGIMPEFNPSEVVDYNSNFVDDTQMTEIHTAESLMKAIHPQEMHLSHAQLTTEATTSSEKENDEDLLNLPTSDLITDEFWPTELNEYLIQKTQCCDLEEYLTFNGDEVAANKKKRRPKRRLKPLKPPKPPKVKKKRPTVQVQITKGDSGQSVYCCPQCNLGYTDKHLLERHLISHKADRRFICEVCGVAMKRKEHIQRHKLGHKDERPFSCSICNKSFKRKEHLDVHFVIHSGDLGKTFPCNECSKRFYRRDHLTTHQKSHVRKQIKRQLKQAENAMKINAKRGKSKRESMKIEQVSHESNTFTIPVQIQVNTNFDLVTSDMIESVINATNCGDIKSEEHILSVL